MYLIIGYGTKGLQKIAAVKANLQLTTVTGNRAGIVSRTNGIHSTEICHPIAKYTTDRTLDLFRHNQTHTLYRRGQSRYIGSQKDLIILGNDPSPIDKFPF